MSKFMKTAGSSGAGGGGHYLYHRLTLGATSSRSDYGNGVNNYQQALLDVDTAREVSKNSTPLSSKVRKIRVCCLLTAGFGRCRTKAASHEFYQDLKMSLGLKVDSRAGHRFMCNAHKEFIDAALEQSKEEEKPASDSAKDSKAPGNSQELNWHSLDIDTLRKYLRVFGIKGFAGATKDDLVHAISLHNSTINVSGMEDLIIDEFIHKVKSQQ